MAYFLFTEEMIPQGLGFSHYGPVHFCWLGGLLLILTGGCLLYRRLGDQGRDLLRKSLALLMMALELCREIGLLFFGNWTPEYIPLHFAGMNLFLVSVHAFRPGKALGCYLYTFCLPGALAALLFPDWTVLPPGNFMHIYSFVSNILLVLYPVMLTVSGDIRPRLRELPWTLLILACLFAAAFPVNIFLGTNFLYLDYADPGNPLYFFGEAFGSHLIGYPILLLCFVLLTHTPWAVYDAVQKYRAGKAAQAPLNSEA